MGKIIQNGIEYSGTYSNATSINYDGSASGLSARTVQEAVDELAAGGGNGKDENGMTVHEKLDYLMENVGGSTKLQKRITTTMDKAVTIDLSSFDGYQNLVLFENLFVITTKIASNVAQAYADITYSYNAETGILNVTGKAGVQWVSVVDVYF